MKLCRTWQPFPAPEHREELGPSPCSWRGRAPASPPALISGGCSATLEKLGLFPQELSHLLAPSCPVLFSRWRGPLFQPCPGSGQSQNPQLSWGLSRATMGCGAGGGCFGGFVSTTAASGCVSFPEHSAWTILRNLGLATRSSATQGPSAEFLPP